MLTKNFYSFLNFSMGQSSAYTTLNGVNDTLSSPYHFVLSLFNSMREFFDNENSSSTAGYYGVAFGNGTDIAKIDDYKLGNWLLSDTINVTCPSTSTFNEVGTYREYTGTFGVANIKSEDIVITEVGLVSRIIYKTTSSSSSSTYSRALIDRTVLDTPITIPAGQSKQITYTIRFNY